MRGSAYAGQIRHPGPLPVGGERGKRAGPMRISHFFIVRPIFAAVVSLVITIIGAIGYCGPRRHAAARDHPAHHHRHRELSRRQRADRGRHGGGADRAGGERRRGHDLHGLAVDRRRQPVADRHLRRRHRHRQGAGAGAEPRQRRRAPPARRGAPQRPHRAQALARPAAGDPPDLARQHLRLGLHLQLRPAQRARQADAPLRRRRRVAVRRARVLHARLARPGAHRAARADGRAGAGCAARAERAGGGRRARRAADRLQERLPGLPADEGAA